MKDQILKLLNENARMSCEEIASRLNSNASVVARLIKELENDNIIKGYKAIINENCFNYGLVRAIIEVKVTPQPNGGFDKIARRIAKFPEVNELYLVSGSYDLKLEIEGHSLQDIAAFVAEKLSTIDRVISTSTLFLLKKYKESGKILESDEEDERLKITP